MTDNTFPQTMTCVRKQLPPASKEIFDEVIAILTKTAIETGTKKNHIVLRWLAVAAKNDNADNK